MKKLILFLFIYSAGINCRHNGEMEKLKIQNSQVQEKTVINSEKIYNENLVEELKGMINYIEVKIVKVDENDQNLENIGKLINFVKTFSLTKVHKTIENIPIVKQVAQGLYEYYIKNETDSKLVEKFENAVIIKLENIEINEFKQTLENLWKNLIAGEKIKDLDINMAIEIWKSFAIGKMSTFECTHKSKNELKDLPTRFQRLIRRKRDNEECLRCKHKVMCAALGIVSTIGVVILFLVIIHHLKAFGA